MNETQTIEPPPTPGNTDADVRARFNQSVSELPPEKRGNVQVPREFEKAEAKTETETQKPEAAKTEEKESIIPDEFLTEKKEVDEWEQAHSQEVKGQVKNEHFKNYKDLTKRKVDALMKELEETRSKVKGDDYVPEKVSKELESIRAALKERDDLISRKYVEETPQFREKFTQREKILTNQATKLGKELGLEDDQISAILSSSGKRQNDLLDEITSDGARSKMAAILLERDRVQDEKSAYLDDHEKHKEEFARQDQERKDAEVLKNQQREKRIFEETLERISASFGPLQKIKGNEKWNQQIEEDVALARAVALEGAVLSPQDWHELFLGGVAWRRGGPMLKDAIEKLNATRAELAALKAAGPSTSQASDGKADPTANMSNDERAAYTFRQLQGAARNSV